MLPRMRLLNFGRALARQSRQASTSMPVARSMRAPRLTLIGGSTMAMLVWSMSSSDCASDEDEINRSADDNNSVGKPDEMERFINYTLIPMGNKLGFGGIAGFCSGIAVRHTTEWLAYIGGLSFIALQVAQYNGYIDIDWFKVQDQSKYPLRSSSFAYHLSYYT